MRTIEEACVEIILERKRKKVEGTESVAGPVTVWLCASHKRPTDQPLDLISLGAPHQKSLFFRGFFLDYHFRIEISVPRTPNNHLDAQRIWASR